MHTRVSSFFVLALSLILSLSLAACVTQPVAPLSRLGLTLAPADLGETLALQQHLKVERNGRIDELDAALEIDSEHLELVGLAFGQRVLSLHYDGKTLLSWRHVMLPSQVRAEDVLEDMQLTLWPIASIRKALPVGWQIEDEGLRRTLSKGDTVVAVINYASLPRWSGTVTLDNLRYGYRLSIQSVVSEPQ